ncbi:MAG: hypothetical protein AABZ42_02755 [Thermoproteota archaeon]
MIIPLEENPKIVYENTIYKYRNDAKLKNIFDILCAILVISQLVPDMMLSSTEIVIDLKEEFEVKQNPISRFHKVQNTLLMKK